MAIRDWPEGERPREKLLERGAAALSDAELLAIFLRVGTHEKTAVELARELLAHVGSLNRLFHADYATCRLPGIGPAKYAQLQAGWEIARRALAEEMQQGDILDSPQVVSDYLRLWLAGRSYEVFAGIFLDARHRVIAIEELARGTLTQTSVYPREVVKRALQHHAAALIVAHNHPSGTAEPSRADEALTLTLKQALALIDVRLLDHLLVAGQQTVSFAARGLL